MQVITYSSRAVSGRNKVKPMWNNKYRRLSRLKTRDNHIAELAWREGKLFFARSHADEEHAAREHQVVEVATVEDAPQQDTQILEGTAADNFYILSGERTFRSKTGGETWEEF